MRNERGLGRDESRERESAPTICVIGAGPAGLAVARALREKNLVYAHLERHSDLGGVWDIEHPGTPMYESAHFISSKTVSGFSGFPMPESFPDYPGHRQIHQYLRDFAVAYGLVQQIEFGAEVSSVRRGEQGGWIVERADGPARRYETVIVCTGTQWQPNLPELPGTFTGEMRHSVSYRNADEFVGTRALIIGGGNSACDIACDAARSADAASISMRRGYWFIPKHVFGMPADIIGGAGSFLPKTLERAVLEPFLKLLVGDPTRVGLQQPDHRLFETHPVLNSQLLNHLQHGDITARPGIERVEGRRVWFADGTSDEFDLILSATGYRHSIPVAQEYFGAEQHPDDLYLTAFSRTHPGLLAVGFIETNSGAYQLFDVLAHIVAGYLRDARDGNPPARRFDALIRDSHPDLSNGLRFDASPRHRGYVDSDALARELRRVARKQGWRVDSPPPVPEPTAMRGVAA